MSFRDYIFGVASASRSAHRRAMDFAVFITVLSSRLRRLRNRLIGSTLLSMRCEGAFSVGATISRPPETGFTACVCRHFCGRFSSGG